LKLNETGSKVQDLCREYGFSSAQFYQWRTKFGGMDASLMKRMKELEDENRRLKKMYAEEKPSPICARNCCKKVVKPSQRKEMAKWLFKEHGVSIRLACQCARFSESCFRYAAKLSGDNALSANWLLRLTQTHKRWGFGLCYLHLQNVKNIPWNHKRDKPDALGTATAIN
jgi:putative transposase